MLGVCWFARVAFRRHQSFAAPIKNCSVVQKYLMSVKLLKYVINLILQTPGCCALSRLLGCFRANGKHSLIVRFALWQCALKVETDFILIYFWCLIC